MGVMTSDLLSSPHELPGIVCAFGHLCLWVGESAKRSTRGSVRLLFRIGVVLSLASSLICFGPDFDFF